MSLSRELKEKLLKFIVFRDDKPTQDDLDVAVVGYKQPIFDSLLECNCDNGCSDCTGQWLFNEWEEYSKDQFELDEIDMDVVHFWAKVPKSNSGEYYLSSDEMINYLEEQAQQPNYLYLIGDAVVCAKTKEVAGKIFGDQQVEAVLIGEANWDVKLNSIINEREK